jgi:hypothetical protein
MIFAIYETMAKKVQSSLKQGDRFVSGRIIGEEVLKNGFRIWDFWG